MFKRLIRNALTIAAIAVGTLALAAAIVFLVRWAKRPSPYSAEGLLAHADDLAWNNNWVAAFPVYVRAEQAFKMKGEEGNALYAHVSQFGMRMETGDLPGLIAELNRDLMLPAANRPEVRLRVLEMKAKCEEEYDSGLAKQTFAEVERLALEQHRFYLASRASGEEGILAFMTGNLAEAARRVKRSYAVAKYLRDPAAHVRYAEILGLGIQQLGRPKQALVFLDEAITTQKAHPEVALPYIAYNAKIDALGDLGRYREALQLADQVLILPRTYQFYGQLQSLLTSRSDVLAKAGRINEALSGYEEALADAKKLRSWRAINNVDGKLALAYEKIGALPKALSAINEAIEANTQTPEEMFLVPGNLAVKARIQAELGRRAEAERLYAKGADVLRALLAHVPTPETERLLLSEIGDLYSGYFELLSNEGRYADAFEVIEQAHGRIEAQELEYDQTAVPRSPTHEDVAFQQLEVGLLHADDPLTRKGILQQILASTQNGSDQKTQETPVSLKALQAELHPEELLIEYVLATRRSYALAVTRSKVNRYILPAKTDIERDVAQYRDRLRKQQINSGLGQRLFNSLLSFTRDYPKSKSLLLVSDGDLHLLPFSALVDDSGRFLLETKSVSTSPSGTVLSILRSRMKKAWVDRPYLGIAPWVDNGNTKPWILRAISSSPKVSQVPPLPDSRDEVESIAAIAPRPSTILIGPEATKEKFESLPISDYRVIHFALHGVVDPVFPDRSALLFAPSKSDDGHLAARDIRQLRLNADLVTLSACDTGVGPVGVSGIESLDTAFIEAGANSVVSTLWDLQDDSGDRFMKAFYKHLKHEGKADALRDAKLDLLHAGSGPYYWAGYELVGDPSGTPFAAE